MTSKQFKRNSLGIKDFSTSQPVLGIASAPEKHFYLLWYVFDFALQTKSLLLNNKTFSENNNLNAFSTPPLIVSSNFWLNHKLKRLLK